MKVTLTQSQFVRRFLEIRPDNFTRSALCALFEHFEEIERDCGGPEVEFDPIAVCCDYSEHASAQDWAANYFAFSNVSAELGLAEGATEEEIEIAAQDYILDRGTMLNFEHGVVVSSF